jgi:hypothetical protein
MGAAGEPGCEPAAGFAPCGTSTMGAGICGAGTPPRSDWAPEDVGLACASWRAAFGRTGALPGSAVFRDALPEAGGSSAGAGFARNATIDTRLSLDAESDAA